MPYTCYLCGKKIGFLNPKPANRCDKPEPLKTEAKKTYFIPDPNGEIFYDKNGDKHKGRAAPDGIEGYRPHVCRRCG